MLTLIRRLTRLPADLSLRSNIIARPSEYCLSWSGTSSLCRPPRWKAIVQEGCLVPTKGTPRKTDKSCNVAEPQMWAACWTSHPRPGKHSELRWASVPRQSAVSVHFSGCPFFFLILCICPLIMLVSSVWPCWLLSCGTSLSASMGTGISMLLFQGSPQCGFFPSLLVMTDLPLRVLLWGTHHVKCCL